MKKLFYLLKEEKMVKKWVSLHLHEYMELQSNYHTNLITIGQISECICRLSGQN